MLTAPAESPHQEVLSCLNETRGPCFRFSRSADYEGQPKVNSSKPGTGLPCGSSKRTGGLDFYEKYCKYFQYRIKARQRGLDGCDTF